MATERTFSIIKPDAVEANNVGNILAMIEGAGLKIKAMRMVHLSRPMAEGFYAVHKERPFFGELVDFMTRGPVVVSVLEGENAVVAYRTLMGATNENFLGAVNSNHAAAVNSNFGGLVANTFVAGYANLNLAAGVDINAGVPLAVNVAGSLTCDLALSGSLFVGGTLDLRLAVDITIALCSLSVTGLAACENVIYLNNNMIDCSGKLFDLKQAIIDYRKADTTVEG